MPRNSCRRNTKAPGFKLGPETGYCERCLRSAAFLRHVEVLDFPDEASTHYAKIRADLKTQGPAAAKTRKTKLGANDLFIAAHARSLGLTLITNNTREFRRVRNLSTGNWTLGA